MSEMLRDQIEFFGAGRDLDAATAEPLLDALLAAEDEEILRELFEAWNRKGISADDIFHFAEIMRSRCTRVRTRHERLVDIVGTGGSSCKTFNVSTAAAFVAAGAGVPVAKHGNRAATSRTGSADVLSALGVEPATDPETAERCLDEIGICFMLAPNYHRLSAALAKVRRGLGFPTVFNCIGPLCNPAGAQFQLIGVWDVEVQTRMAQALAKLGTGRSWLVHGEPGLDEITLSGRTRVADVADGTVSFSEVLPENFGFSTTKDFGFRADSPESSAKIIEAALDPTLSTDAARTLVEINAAAAIFISGAVETLSDARKRAEESIASGNAAAKLAALSEACK